MSFYVTNRTSVDIFLLKTFLVSQKYSSFCSIPIFRIFVVCMMHLFKLSVVKKCKFFKSHSFVPFAFNKLVKLRIRLFIKI